MSYFWGKTKGLKADIERHRAEEAELNARIAELEGSQEKNRWNKSILQTYRGFRNKLLESKAEVVSKIGRRTK